MKTFTKSLTGLLSASALAIGLAVIAQPAAAGVANSPHNLSMGTDTATSTTQICVFCHTPHASNTSVEAPLWNKALPGSTYTLYASATMDGTTSAGSVSLACLSCHDGTQARDNMINRPGSGGYNATGQNLTGNPGTVGPIANNVARLGTDLSNDHPIGMRYCAALTVDDVINGACGDDSFNALAAGTALTRVWIDTGVADGVYQKTDMPLYGGNANIGLEGNVECATCHDPHSTTNPTFLRVSNNSSQVCLTCHNK